MSPPSIAVRNAESMARTFHASHVYGALRYVVHLEEVAALVTAWAPAAPDDEADHLVAAAWLHDAVEMGMSPSDLDPLPPRVAALVLALSRPVGTRRAVEEEYLRQIVAGGPGAVLIKLCDRLANVRACKRDHDKKMFMYMKEYETFRARLFRCDSRLMGLEVALDQEMGWRRQPHQFDALTEARERVSRQDLRPSGVMPWASSPCTIELERDHEPFRPMMQPFRDGKSKE